MKLKYILVVLVISASLIVNCEAAKKSAKNNEDVDDDEFAEFDNFDSEDDGSEKTSKKAAKNNQNEPQVKTFKQEKSSDFDEFDATIEDDDENDKQQKPAQSTQKPTTQTTSAAKEQKNEQQQKVTPKIIQQNDETLDMEEFENFVDEEEFENFDDKQTSIELDDDDNDDNDEDVVDKTTKKTNKKTQSNSKSAKKGEPDLKIASVPEHLLHMNNWQNYYWEIVMIIGILVYGINFFIGKSKNFQISNAWFNSNRELLEKNFALVGDDGSSVEAKGENATIIKESESNYAIWCSGRQSCLSMFIQLRLIKRQDLISLVAKMFKPQCDQIVISVEFERKDIDSYVFCLANRKQAQNLMRDYQDLSTYCVEKKTASDKYGLDAKYVLLNENGEIPTAILDSRVCGFLNKYPDMIDYILISDQYVGFKLQQDDQANQQNKAQIAATSSTAAPGNEEATYGLQNSRSMMIICLNVVSNGKNSTLIEDIEKMQPGLQLAFYLIDKIPRITLSKEAKVRAIKKRKEITEANLKQTNKQRQEAAQQRKEEKRRAEKERIMNESDPEKQKLLEDKLLKKESKRNQPKLKQIKIKSM